MVFTLVLIGLTWFVWKFKTDGLSRTNLLIGWGIKVLFGVLFMIIHTKIYGIGEVTVDWEEYMADSVTLNGVAYQSVGDYLHFLLGTNSEAAIQQYLSHTNHWSAGDLDLMNDSRNVLRVNSLIVFISQGNVYVHILFFSFFSFIGLREIFLAFKDRIFYKKSWFWFALFLFPTLSFWTSSVLKEPLMILGFGFLLNVLLGKLALKSRLWRMVLGFALMLGFKPYVLGCLLLSLPVFLLGKFLFRKRVLLAPLTGLALITLIFAIFPGFRNNVTHRLTRMQFDFINVGRGGTHAYADSCFYYFRTDQYPDLEFRDNGTVQARKTVIAKKVTFGMSYPFQDIRLKPGEGPWKVVFMGEACGSYVELTPIGNDFGQLIKNIPEAASNAAFRPTFWDPGGKLKIVSFLETIGLFVLLAFGLWYNWRYRTAEERNLLVFLMTFSLVLFVLIGWTTPVLGAIVRYRMPAYLALFLMAFIGSRPFKFKL
ncbi:hypothetical protein [Fluviicola chungangensis]|uniref:Glycosyltransferase RgtA/B/C/D-like domain-containing protein n=1 Tax=Fluviicola chungangensis TaxID=2597671 RepID=A0A556MYQ5_9FLAO|nr:hypothetical protein [Fluviicola chungangensis]TSJ45060.1 hypothetical protein FO442_10730 [Fluviicola chungangensis]